MSVQLNDPLYVDAEDSQGNKRTAPNRGFLITNKMMTIGLVLLALNLLATLGLIVAFGAFAIGAQNAMHDANKTAHDLVSGMGLLPQISKMVRTNLDLTTWSSFFQDASDRLGQVANVDWSHTETYTQYRFEECDSYDLMNDRATCKNFVGDENKECTWYVTPSTPDPNPPCSDEYDAGGCCYGDARKQDDPMTASLAISEADSHQIQKTLSHIKSALDTAIAHLPGPKGKNTPTSSHPGLSAKTCANIRPPLDVESSLINVPQTLDTMVRDLNCLVAKIADQGDAVTLSNVQTIYHALESIGGNPDPDVKHDLSNINTFMATANMVKALLNKYLVTVKN